LFQIQHSVLEFGANDLNVHPLVSNLKERWTSGALKGIMIATLLQVFLQLSGVVAITGYAVDIFNTTTNEGSHQNLFAIILGIVNLVK